MQRPVCEIQEIESFTFIVHNLVAVASFRVMNIPQSFWSFFYDPALRFLVASNAYSHRRLHLSKTHVWPYYLFGTTLLSFSARI